jgi:anthranilate/para-aminobenzoate synthase component II
LENPFTATRYHSLVVKRDTLPACLEITAETRPELEIMGLRHKEYPIWGVQFHPESVLTTEGKKLLKNFLTL